MQLKSIWRPVDFSDFSTAVLSLAQYCRARLLALRLVELWKYPFADDAAHEADYGKFSRALNEGGEVRLREFVEKHSAAGVQPKLVVHQGDASNCVLSFPRKDHMEGIVIGTHGRRGFDRPALGSTTDRVIRNATCPVLVVSNPCHRALVTGPNGRHRLRRILTARIFRRTLSEGVGKRFRWPRVWRRADVVARGREGRRVGEDGGDYSRAYTRTRKLVSETERSKLLVRAAVRFEKPYEEMVREASETQASLVIVIARGGDAADRDVFGSTMYRVIQSGPRPRARGPHMIDCERRVGFHGQHHHH